jgi:hypothetical protein
MNTFLTALVGTLAAIVIVVLIGWWWIKRKIASFTEGMMQAMSGMAGVVPAFRITLTENQLEWSDEPAVNAVTAELDYIGFTKIGDFRCQEMFLTMRAFQHPAKRCYAVIYDSEIVGTSVDLVTNTTDGQHLCVSSHTMAGMMALPAWSEAAKLPLDLKAQPEDVVKLPAELDRLIAGRPLQEVAADAFAAHFIEMHEREMDWHIDRGGVTEEEIRRMVDADPANDQEPEQEAIQNILNIWKGSISQHVDDEVRQTFLGQNHMTAAEWDKKQDRVFFVHEKKALDELIATITDRMLADQNFGGDDDDEDEDEEDEAYERAEKTARERVQSDFDSATTLREGYADALLTLPVEQRPEKIGTVDDGRYPADVYLNPESEFQD